MKFAAIASLVSVAIAACNVVIVGKVLNTADDTSGSSLAFGNQGAKAVTKTFPDNFYVRQASATVTKDCKKCSVTLKGERLNSLTADGRDITQGNSKTVTLNYPGRTGLKKLLSLANKGFIYIAIFCMIPKSYVTISF
jgi:hypothetical protein